MKTLIKTYGAIVLTLIVLLNSSCQSKEERIVRRYIRAVNESDIKSLEKLLSEDFVQYDSENGDTISKQEYLRHIDSMRQYKRIFKILSIKNNNDVINTEVSFNNLATKTLNITETPKHFQSYKVVESNITYMSTDSITGRKEYTREFHEKSKPFLYWAYNIENREGINNKIVEDIDLLNKYSSLSKSKKTEYASLATEEGERAIELVKSTPARDYEETWLDYANNIAQNNSNIKYSWTSSPSTESSVYIVGFTDADGWGYYWETNLLTEQTVKFVFDNEYLARKHGFHKLDSDKNFIISSTNKRPFEITQGALSKSNFVVYSSEFEIINNTNKTLDYASASARLAVIFKEKVVDDKAYDGMNIFLSPSVTKESLWLPGASRTVYFRTVGIDELYLYYLPEYVILEVGLYATDPIGFKYNKNILELDLKEEWKEIMKTNN